MIEYSVIIKLLVAIIVGGLIGYERSFNNRPAGLRTHILVCVGATVVSIIQIEVIEQTKEMIIANPVLAQSLKADIGRMGAQVISGVGFLGAGTIIREKGFVKGLTTAASLWVVACIGLAIGLGMYFITIVSTISIFISLVLLKKVESKLIYRSRMIEFELDYYDDTNFIKDLHKYFKLKNIKVVSISFLSKYDDELFIEEDRDYKKALYTVETNRYVEDTKILKDLCKKDGIIKVKII